MSSFPFLHGKSLPLSQNSSHQLTREYHHSSRETFHFKPLSPFPQRTSRSSQMVRFEMESSTMVPAWWSSAKMTSSTSGMLSQAPIVVHFRQRRSPSKKPSNGYPPFHHGTQLSSSATANHWFRPSATLTQLTRLSSNYRLQRNTRHAKIIPDRVGSWSLCPVRQRISRPPS